MIIEFLKIFLDENIINNLTLFEKKIENDLIENDLIKNESIENESIKNDLIENDLIKNESIENKSIKNDLIENDLIKNESIENKSIKNESIENESIEKKNYILLILILIFLIAGLSGLYYSQLQETIPDILNTIKKCVDDDTHLQVKKVVEEILVKPNKKLMGLEILKLMKLIVQPHRIYDADQFYKCIDKLIKILDK